MGATKRVCEMIIQYYNGISSTRFAAVRFGNVLGSNGSVVPLFKKQIEMGGPVTVTHPDIVRYFMTIPEAVSLVLQAGALAEQGGILILDMGKPVRIRDMAYRLIRLSGYVPDKEIKVVYTGLRPGEKIFEELVNREEALLSTSNSLIHVGKEIDLPEDFLQKLESLRVSIADENADVRALLRELVPTYESPLPTIDIIQPQ
jgi:FlaA1/EpsC-like NDP-sugar epimerase